VGSGTGDLELHWKHWQWGAVKNGVLEVLFCGVTAFFWDSKKKKLNPAQQLLFVPDYYALVCNNAL